MKNKTIKELKEDIRRYDYNVPFKNDEQRLKKQNELKVTLKQTELIKKAVEEIVDKWKENANIKDMVFEEDGIGGTEGGYTGEYIEELKSKLKEIFEGQEVLNNPTRNKGVKSRKLNNIKTRKYKK